MMLNNIEYRKLNSIKEFKSCEELQLKVWGFSEREIFPARHLLTAQNNGGLVIGAFLDNELIGYSYGFLGYSDNSYYHYSHMLGILKDYRHKDIGYNLKLLQRKLILENEINVIKWTFDPLEGPNAHLNLHKLGAVIRKYYNDYYGEFSGINYGLPTDRFLAEWELKSERVINRIDRNIKKQLSQIDVTLITKTEKREDGFLELKDVNLHGKDNILLVEVPGNFQEIKNINFELARDWRFKSRDIFTTYLNQGYIITDFFTSLDKKERKNFYLLEMANNAN